MDVGDYANASYESVVDEGGLECILRARAVRLDRIIRIPLYPCGRRLALAMQRHVNRTRRAVPVVTF